ncbi:MAG TPA: hypothetical protein VIZ18_02650, partial [Ktedonobacteraceae bacterium]
IACFTQTHAPKSNILWGARPVKLTPGTKTGYNSRTILISVQIEEVSMSTGRHIRLTSLASCAG